MIIYIYIYVYTYIYIYIYVLSCNFRDLKDAAFAFPNSGSTRSCLSTRVLTLLTKPLGQHLQTGKPLAVFMAFEASKNNKWNAL